MILKSVKSFDFDEIQDEPIVTVTVDYSGQIREASDFAYYADGKTRTVDNYGWTSTDALETSLKNKIGLHPDTHT